MSDVARTICRIHRLGAIRDRRVPAKSVAFDEALHSDGLIARSQSQRPVNDRKSSIARRCADVLPFAHADHHMIAATMIGGMHAEGAVSAGVAPPKLNEDAKSEISSLDASNLTVYHATKPEDQNVVVFPLCGFGSH